MTTFTVCFPSEEEIEQNIRFRTYLNYVSCISSYIKEDEIIKVITLSRSFSQIQGRKCQDKDKLGLILRNSWFTEVQLLIPSEIQDFIPYANHWVPVQAYYIIYLLIRAYFLTSGQSVSHEHATNLKCISNEIKNRADLFPFPWRTLCIGDPKSDIPHLLNAPEGITINKISNLNSIRTGPFWDFYALLLKTTRERQLNTLCNEWKMRNKKHKVNSKVRKKYCENLSPTSLFNFLYRLRLRSNYIDADSFLIGPIDKNESQEFYNAICKLVWSNCLIFETLVARYIGKKLYEEIINSFSKYDTLKKSYYTINKRWEIIKNLW